MKGSRSWCAVSVAVVVLVLVPTVAREGQRAATPPGPYAVTDLGTLGTVQSANAYDLNDAGQVVGNAASRAFVWQNGTMAALPSSAASSASAINSFGQIAGAVRAAGSQWTHAVRWDNGVLTDLTPELTVNDNATATGINDAGYVIGTINYGTAFLWRNGVRTPLGHLGGGGSSASDINDAGQIVGSSYTTHVTELGPMQHPFLWQNGVMTDLGILPGDEDGGAAAINRAGDIVGSSGRTDPQTYETAYRAFLYSNGAMTALPVPSFDSHAGDINDAGVVVGTMRAGGGFSKHHAWIYADGVVTNLNTLIPAGSGLHLAYATGINNAGQIIGTAFDARGSYHAFLLTPVAAGTPVVQVGDATVVEGHAGTGAVTFTVSLSTAASQPISVSYATANASAAAGSDYQPVSGAVTFAAGETSKAIPVPVVGDRSGEANETFLLNVGLAAGNAAIGDAQGVATIVDDEPRMSIDSVTKNEGNAGTTAFTFTVSLSAASAAAVSVNFATADGSAKAEDYESKSGTLAFTAGQTARTVTINVKGDRKAEFQEVFYVNLSAAAGAYLQSNQGTGVIRNDDR